MPSMQYVQTIHCKKVTVFPISSWDVTNQTLPGRKLLNYSRLGWVWLVTSRLGSGITITFFYCVGTFIAWCLLSIHEYLSLGTLFCRSFLAWKASIVFRIQCFCCVNETKLKYVQLPRKVFVSLSCGCPVTMIIQICRPGNFQETYQLIINFRLTSDLFDRIDTFRWCVL
jgi:hypothetical protein